MTAADFLHDLPMPIKTPRLTLKRPEPFMAQAFHEAIQETMTDLKEWMMWADRMKTISDSDDFIRKKIADFASRDDLIMFVFDQNDKLIGATGLHLPNHFKTPIMQVGYWIRPSERSKGYVTEWTNALTRYAFDVLKIKKLSIDIDSENQPSMAVAQRLGFDLEYQSKWGIAKPGTDAMRILNMYSRFDTAGLPPLEVSWG